jgi:hypothetical protein
MIEAGRIPDTTTKKPRWPTSGFRKVKKPMINHLIE